MQTITFYSYKGGTGRTLAVANTAMFLARFGQSVFVLDFDLEAPGLHYKFKVRPKRGLVDFIEEFERTHSFPDIEKYILAVVDLPPEFRQGKITLLPAGDSPSPEYSHRLAGIRLPDLFHPVADSRVPVALPLFLELQARIERQFQPDFLLIDSRTGITEIGSLAVQVMPDILVCLLHSNPENIAGARKVLRNARTAFRMGGKPRIETIAVLARIPEQPLAKEITLLEDTKRELCSESDPEDPLVDEVLPLHSDPDLQITEALRIGATTTANESAVFRDYFKLFRKLKLDEHIKDQRARPVMEALAEADHTIRSLMIGRRSADGESSRPPIESMTERLQRKTDRLLNVVHAEYLTGHEYLGLIKLVREQIRVGFRLVGEDTPEEVRWDLLATHLREGKLDFCDDLYYLTENRGLLADVVQLGWCRTFTAYVRKDSEMHQALAGIREVRFADFAFGLAARLERWSCSGLAVGVLGDTPAASEANRGLSPILRAKKLVSKGSEDDLLKWLEDHSIPEPKIAICDWVVAGKMDEILGNKGKYASVPRFEFAQPIPVGVAYPREDSEWRKVLAKAIADSLVRFLDAKHQDGKSQVWQTIQQEFHKNELDVLGLDVLRHSLLLDLTFEQALSWNSQFKQAADMDTEPIQEGGT